MAMLINEPTTWNVLVTDDEPDSIGVVEFVFEFYGVHIRTAPSGTVCLQLIQEMPPDILILDIQMPVMSGWEVIKTIRNDSNLRHIIVVAMTAHAMSGDRERIIAGGFNGYFPKPISPSTLIKDLQTILSQQLPLQIEGKAMK